MKIGIEKDEESWAMWWPRLKLLGLLIFEPAPRYFRHGLARIFSAANLTVFSIRFALLV